MSCAKPTASATKRAPAAATTRCSGSGCACSRARRRSRPRSAGACASASASRSPRFDYLAQLDRAKGGLKMSELSRLLMVTGGNVTGLTDELARDGLVSREASPADRRAWIVRLTPKGKSAFAAMAEEHERWIRELFAGFDADAVAALHAQLGTLRVAPAREAEPERGRSDMTDIPIRRRRRPRPGARRRQPPPARRLPRAALPVGAERRRRRDHAQPPRAQEPAHLRLVRRAARPVRAAAPRAATSRSSSSPAPATTSARAATCTRSSARSSS